MDNGSVLRTAIPSVQLGVRLSVRERDLFDAVCRATGTGPAGLIRRLVRQEAERLGLLADAENSPENS